MASIYSSAQRSIASAFDVLGVTAESAVKLVKTGALAIDSLDVKAQSFHRSVVESTKFGDSNLSRKEVMRHAAEMTDLLEVEHRYLGTIAGFDKAAVYKSEVTRLEALLAE